MKKFFFAALIVGSAFFAYFWYIRGINILALEDSNPLPLYGVAVRLPSKDSSADPATFKWFNGTQMPSVRSGMASASIDNHLYVFGGVDGFGRTLGTSEMYDAKTDAWTVLRGLPHPVQNAGAAALDGKIYVIGGAEGLSKTSVNFLQIYDAGSNTWSDGAKLPSSLSGAAVVANGSKIHVFGGMTIGSIVATHYIYDPAAGSWGSGEELPNARSGASGVMVGHRICVLGGQLGSLAYNTDRIDCFDLERNTWEEATSLMPHKRSDMTALTLSGKIYLFGGEAPTVTFDVIDSFDLASNKWETLTEKMPTARHGMAGLVYNGAFFLIGGGGRPGLSVSQLNEVFQSPTVPAPANGTKK